MNRSVNAHALLSRRQSSTCSSTTSERRSSMESQGSRRSSLKSTNRLPSYDFEQSLSLMDLQGTEEEDKKKFMELSAVFEEIVVATAVEYETRPHPKLERTSSAPRMFAKTVSHKHPRRHSAFEAGQAANAYFQHAKIKEYIESLEDKIHPAFIQQLLDFNLSVNMASMSDLSMMDQSPALHYSCPVLSYMNDDEEDSVELATHKKGTKRPSLGVLNEDSEQAWESLDDTNTTENEIQQYEITISPIEEEKPRPKRRKPPSCTMLTQRLQTEHPQQILRSLGAF